jgi:4-hydroxy-tetrahydrodipicolinate synthase
VANVAPVLMAKLCDAMVNGDKKTGMVIQEQLLSLNELLFTESNPIPVKWALFRMGLMNDEIRLPLTRLAPQYRQALEQELQTLQLI